VTITNSTLTFMEINSFLNNAPATKTLSFENLKISDSVIGTQMYLFSTSGMKYSQDIRFVFTNMTVDGITFANTGEILDLGHSLPNALVIQNSTFTNLRSAKITIGSTTASRTETLKSKVIIRN